MKNKPCPLCRMKAHKPATKPAHVLYYVVRQGDKYSNGGHGWQGKREAFQFPCREWAQGHADCFRAATVVAIVRRK